MVTNPDTRANKRLIYAYYGNKEQLFDTVMVHSLGVLADAVPFFADSLPGYAGALFDHMLAHPDLVRLTLWKMLERPAVSELEAEVYRPKVVELAAAQQAGVVDPDIGSVDLLMLVLGLVASWFTASPSLHALGAGSTAGQIQEHRAALIAAIQRLCGPR